MLKTDKLGDKQLVNVARIFFFQTLASSESPSINLNKQNFLGMQN